MLRTRELAFVTAVAMAAMAGASLWQSVQPSKSLAAHVAQTHPLWVKVQQRVAVKITAIQVPKPVAAMPKVAAPKDDAAIADEDTDRDGAKPLSAADLLAQDAQLDKQSGDVAERLQGKVPADLMRYFDVVLYVSKAGAGPWSQHMFIFHRNADGTLAYERNIPVSTGREQHEKYFTSTPTGIFELDPNRFEPMHYSHTWHGAPMAWAMFLNYTHHWRQVGIALHSAGEHIADLGHRASGGCVRLPPDQADLLYHRFQSEERGMVPALAFDNAAGSTSTMGETMHGPDGLPLMTEGYKVLLVIEDYPGGPALVAVLS